MTQKELKGICERFDKKQSQRQRIIITRSEDPHNKLLAPTALTNNDADSLMQAGDDVACHAVARVLSAVASESEPVWRARFLRAAQVPGGGAPGRGRITLVLPAEKTVPNVVSSPVRSRSTALIKRRSVNRKWQQQVAAAKRELELEVAPASRTLAARFDEVAGLSVDTGSQE